MKASIVMINNKFMIPENCKKIVINNPFYEEDITQEEIEYIVSKEDMMK